MGALMELLWGFLWPKVKIPFNEASVNVIILLSPLSIDSDFYKATGTYKTMGTIWQNLHQLQIDSLKK